MRKSIILPTISLSIAALLGLSGCSSEPEVIAVYRPQNYHGGPAMSVGGYRDSSQVSYRSPSQTYHPASTYQPTSSARSTSTYQPRVQTVSTPVARHNSSAVAMKVYSEARVRRDFLPRSARGRTGRSMRPRYITIHSTQNWSRGADAWRHSLALKRSKLGSLSWHYTVDESVAVQHLPTTEQGKHADFDGPGNKYSIGIEMCEHPGNSRSATLERTAKLTAWLMYKNNIPISRVVPHYHWPRWGKNPPNKNCPHFLLDNGRPGKKWRAYQAKIKSYYDEIASPQTPNWVSR